MLWSLEGLLPIVSAMLDPVAACRPACGDADDMLMRPALLLYGTLLGGFLALAWIAFISFIFSHARTFIWISLTAFSTGMVYLVSNADLLTWIDRRAAGLDTALMPPLAASAGLCFLGFLWSMARRDAIQFHSLSGMTRVAVLLIVLNVLASLGSVAVSDTALGVTVLACIAVILHTLRRTARTTMTSMMVATIATVAFVLLQHISVLADRIDRQVLTGQVETLTITTGTLLDIVSACACLTLLIVWYNHIGTQRSAVRSVLAIWQVKEHVRLSREVKRQTLALNQALAYAHEKNKQKIQTLGYVGHDLRAPLATILGYVRLIRDTPHAPNGDHLGAIERSVHYQLALIDDVLDYAKAELQPLHLHATAVAPARLLNDVVAHAYTLGHANQNRFVYAPPAELPALLMLDGNRLQQVLINLLSNASKYTLRGTFSLTLSAQAGTLPDTWWLRFSVQDDGIGVAMQEQASIFDAFRQLERTSAGVGLGLFIAEGIVEKMGGTLSIESKLGEGSLFSFDVVVPVVDPSLVAVQPYRLGDLGPLPQGPPAPAAIAVPPAPARLELALLARDGQISGIEDWLQRMGVNHADHRHFYDAVREALLKLDLVAIETLALQTD